MLGRGGAFPRVLLLARVEYRAERRRVRDFVDAKGECYFIGGDLLLRYLVGVWWQLRLVLANRTRRPL